MRQRTIWTALLLVTFAMGTYAQGEDVTAKITDLEKVTTTVQNASSSSSSSCGTSDFPVYQGTDLKDVDIADLTWISVRHDLTPSDPSYIKVELTFKDGREEIYEMVRYIRFTGKTEEGSFAMMVKDINTIEIVQKI
ncbi:MAG: hypothetical protein U9R49_03435 [Bacteroidota bacterium]|nr:hypothetical protein [Bacteroidota bacterium]